MERVTAALLVVMVAALIAAAVATRRYADEARRVRAKLAQARLDAAHAKAEHAAGRMNDDELAKELDRILDRVGPPARPR